MTDATYDIVYLEIVAEDVAATSQFFAKVHGYEFGEPVPELGNAVVAHRPDGSRLGIRASMNPQETPTVRTYLRVDDVEAETKRAEEAGAVIALPPMPLGNQGTIAVYLIGGIEQGIWQLPADAG